MASDDFSDSTLVLMAHGSTTNLESGATAYQHGGELRRRKIFGEVLEAFWKQEPKVSEVLRAAGGKRVFIVPLFISEGYFSDEVIPRELGFRREVEGQWWAAQERGGQRLFYCEPVGTHPSMADALEARAWEVVLKHPFPRAPKMAEVTLFIAGHGTERNEKSRKAMEEQAARLRERGRFAGVHAVFMEEAPRIQECYQLSETRWMVVVPFFISDGMHSVEDIPVLLGEPERIVKARVRSGQATWRNPTERNGKLVWYASSIGTAEQLADVILERVRECGGRGAGF